MAKAPSKGGLVAIMGTATLAAGLMGALTSFEGKRNVGYKDVAGIPTACFGDTANVVVGKFYGDAECQARLEQQASAHVAEVVKCTPHLRGWPLVAASSLAYNIGGPAYCGSTAAKRFNAGDIRGGCDALLSWNKARVNGTLVMVKGLANRRAAERAICLRTGA